ncbi:hypothetical protein [Candidatus Mycalebacterium sp.]
MPAPAAGINEFSMPPDVGGGGGGGGGVTVVVGGVVVGGVVAAVPPPPAHPATSNTPIVNRAPLSTHPLTFSRIFETKPRHGGRN